VTRRLTCPKCQNDTFRLSMSKRQETLETVPQVTKMTIVTFLHITCANCGWSQRLTKAESG
jgi:predicted nucleic-acid-binding Zn-ribbon protein